MFWRREAVFWATYFDSGLHLSGRPLRNSPGLESKAGNVIHRSCPFLFLRLWPWNKAIFTAQTSPSYPRWVVKPRCWTLAMKFFKGKTINLDLLAKFQSLYLTSYLSSSGSFSYHDLHLLWSLQLPCNISLLPSAEVADYPALVLIQHWSMHFGKRHCC